MNRRIFLSSAAAMGALTAYSARTAPTSMELQVFKSASCGCCGAWVDHMKAAGFSVKVTNVDDTTAARKRAGMPDRFGSCHTATIAGYAVEGHVPAADVKRLLATRPKAIGLAVPDMPPGSPGMEQGGRRLPYDVLLVDLSGRESVYASYS